MVKNVKSGHTVLLEAYNLYFKYLMANTRPESTSSKIAFARVFDNFPTTLEQEGSVPILENIQFFLPVKYLEVRRGKLILLL